MTTKQNKINIDWGRQYFNWNEMTVDSSTLSTIAKAAKIRIRDALNRELNNQADIIANMFEYILPILVYNAEHGNDIATINMEEHIVLEYPDCIKSEFPNFNPSKWVIVNIWREMIIQCLTKKLVDNGFTIYNIQYNIHCNNTWSFNMNIAWYI